MNNTLSLLFYNNNYYKKLNTNTNNINFRHANL